MNITDALRLSVGGQDVVRAVLNGQVVWQTPAIINPGSFAYLRGINLAGGEFNPTPSGLPGVYDVDYAYDISSTYSYMRSRGHRLIRLPFRWERIQPTLGGPLSTSGISELTQAVQAAANAGLLVLLDMHNYGRYTDSTDTERIFSGGISEAQFSDVWSRLVAHFAAQPAIVGWGLMNEPHDLPAPQAGAFTGTEIYNFDISSQGWTGDGTTVVRSTAQSFSGSGSLAVTKTGLLTGQVGQTLRTDDAGNNTRIVANGDTWAARVLVPAGQSGQWSARIEVQNDSFQWQVGPDTSLTPGVWTEIRYTPSGSVWAQSPNPIGIQFTADNVTNTTATVYVDTVSHGTSAATPTVWKTFSQAAVTAIRAVGDMRTVFVGGDAWSGAKEWAVKNGDPWISDSANNVIYEAHYYFDSDNSGQYGQSYATVNSDAVSRGYANLSARVTAEISDFTQWLSAHNQRGFIGEIGWPYDTADASSWNLVGATVYEMLNTANVGATYWASGVRWGNSYRLNAYQGSPNWQPESQAAVIESYLTPETAQLSRSLSVPFYSVFNAESAQSKQSWSAAGGTHCVIAARWTDLEPTQGTISSTGLSALKQQFAEAASAGLGVIFSFSTHYTPGWIKAAAPRFRNQNGTDWTSMNSLGDDVVDVVWSQTAREAIASFQTAVWSALTITERAQIKGFRLGGGPYGELHFPTPGDPVSWWGYSSPAQTGTGLANGMVSCPVPGHIPFVTTSANLLDANTASIETSTAGWVAGTDTTLTRQTAPTGGVYQGSAVLQMARTGTTGKVLARFAPASRIVVSPGQTITASGYTRNATQGRSTLFGIEWYDAGGALITTDSYTLSATSLSWSLMSRSATAPDGAASAGIVWALDPAQASTSQVFYGDAFTLTSGSADQDFVEWYLDSLTRYMVWQVERVRTLGYTGSIHVLHPSFGLRSNMAFGSDGYRIQAAEGVDYARQVAAYPDAEVWPQSTWGNGEDPVPGSAIDSDQAAWRKLLSVAQAHGRLALLACENTGGSSTSGWDDNSDVDRMFSADGAMGLGYVGLTWLNWPRLNGEVAGTHATIAHLSTYMNQ